MEEGHFPLVPGTQNWLIDLGSCIDPSSTVVDLALYVTVARSQISNPPFSAVLLVRAKLCTSRSLDNRKTISMGYVSANFLHCKNGDIYSKSVIGLTF